MNGQSDELTCFLSLQANTNNMEKIICGIQQMGIGVPNVQEIWKWYRKFFGMNVRVFEEAAEAPLMTRYTGGQVHSRTATLALSMEGGGGFEIWQFTSRQTEKPTFEVQAGDFGLYSCKMKSRDIKASFDFFKSNGAEIIGDLFKLPNGQATFYTKDPNGNIFQLVTRHFSYNIYTISFFNNINSTIGCFIVIHIIIDYKKIYVYFI